VSAAHLDGAGASALRGAGSCAASACHGGIEAVPENVSFAKRNEHTTWLTSDPHAEAYNVLFSERSKSIAKNLGEAFGEAHKAPRCLACHSTVAVEPSQGDDRLESIQRDGVSCESCHGAAGGWIGEHTTNGWPSLSPDQKAERGFNTLRDQFGSRLGTRAQTCTGCHIGAPEDKQRGLPLRDMNHDFIAAGHPRLNWEFSAYVANYPKHWRVDQNEKKGLDGKLWKIGQIASMQAELALLQDRCARVAATVDKAPWPEFSEYGCFSCHFTLKKSPFRVNRDPDVALGVPVWGSWYVPMLKVLAESHPGFAAVGEDLKSLRKVMNNLEASPEDVSTSAGKLKGELDNLLKSMDSAPLDSTEISLLINALDSTEAIVTSWDSAAQLYLGLAALYRSSDITSGIGPNPAFRARLEALRKDLEYRPRFDSPRDDFDPSKVK
jgi:hypothetical protein